MKAAPKVTPEQRRLLTKDATWVNSKRFNNSLDKLLERYPEGAPDYICASALMIPEEEVPKLYDQIVAKLRKLMGV
jgi:hypothetical protein